MDINMIIKSSIRGADNNYNGDTVFLCIKEKV